MESLNSTNILFHSSTLELKVKDYETDTFIGVLSLANDDSLFQLAERLSNLSATICVKRMSYFVF